MNFRELETEVINSNTCCFLDLTSPGQKTIYFYLWVVVFMNEANRFVRQNYPNWSSEGSDSYSRSYDGSHTSYSGCSNSRRTSC